MLAVTCLFIRNKAAFEGACDCPAASKIRCTRTSLTALRSRVRLRFRLRFAFAGSVRVRVGFEKRKRGARGSSDLLSLKLGLCEIRASICIKMSKLVRDRSTPTATPRQKSTPLSLSQESDAWQPLIGYGSRLGPVRWF